VMMVPSVMVASVRRCAGIYSAAMQPAKFRPVKR
jgi:hypothetical protein